MSPSATFTKLLATSRNGNSTTFQAACSTVGQSFWWGIFFPYMQPILPLVHLEVISSWATTCDLEKETDPHLASISFQEGVEHNKVSPQPPLFQSYFLLATGPINTQKMFSYWKKFRFSCLHPPKSPPNQNTQNIVGYWEYQVATFQQIKSTNQKTQNCEVMVSSGLKNTFLPLPTHKVYFTYFSHPFQKSCSHLCCDSGRCFFFELILADCLWEAKNPQMSAVVLSDFLRQSDKFGTDSESYSMNTFRTRLEIAQNYSFQCEYMAFYHSNNTITSPVKKTHRQLWFSAIVSQLL